MSLRRRGTAAVGLAVAAALSLAGRLRAADPYAELSKIAPTVFSIRPGFPWKGAVEAGRATDVPDATWYLGVGVTSEDRSSVTSAPTS
ncbi:hypothetical protein [Streptomyces sp. NBC_00887]|uniref:hypothetical protein n=1 Tax=Streptomyces sp. NBC_00887 TaxID=2975859 RepID=UPI00386C802B|nr:hypothetical protein OG844_34950 [Streptomyces sp. NBC_00887]